MPMPSQTVTTVMTGEAAMKYVGRAGHQIGIEVGEGFVGFSCLVGLTGKETNCGLPPEEADVLWLLMGKTIKVEWYWQKYAPFFKRRKLVELRVGDRVVVSKYQSDITVYMWRKSWLSRQVICTLILFSPLIIGLLENKSRKNQ
jgi:hypothetical protein